MNSKWNGKNTGYRKVHHKYNLPEEDGWHEQSWYERGEKDFSVIEISFGKIGFLICTELWFNAPAREYALQDIDLLLCPRATGESSTDKWIAGGGFEYPFVEIFFHTGTVVTNFKVDLSFFSVGIDTNRKFRISSFIGLHVLDNFGNPIPLYRISSAVFPESP